MFKKLGKFFTKDVPNFFSKDVPEFVKEDVADFVKEDVADFVTEDIPDFVTEDVPEFITEDLPEGTMAIIGQKKLKEEVEELRETKAELMAELATARNAFFDLSLRYTQAEAIYRARLEIYGTLPQSHHAETDVDYVEDVDYDRAMTGLDKIMNTWRAARQATLSFISLGLTDLYFKPLEMLKEKEHLEGENKKIRAAIAEIKTADTGLTAGLEDINTALAKLDTVLEARGLQFQSNPEDRLRFEEARSSRTETILATLIAEGTSPQDAHRIVNKPMEA